MKYQLIWVDGKGAVKTYLNESNSKVNNIRHRLKREGSQVGPVLKVNTGLPIKAIVALPNPRHSTYLEEMMKCLEDQW